jgi:hypothetical protein
VDVQGFGKTVLQSRYILWRVGWYTSRKWRVLVRMTGFYYHTLVTTIHNNTSITLNDSLPSAALSLECWLTSIFSSELWTLDWDSTQLYSRMLWMLSWSRLRPMG